MKSFILKIAVTLVLFFAFGYYIYRNLTEINLTFHTTMDSLTSMMSWALIVGIGSYVFIVLNYQRIFRLFGIKKGFWEMTKLDLSSLATSVVIPTFGLAGALAFVDDAIQKKYSRSSAFAAVIFNMLCDYTAITLLLVIALIYLFLDRSLGLNVTIPSFVFIVIIALVYFVQFSASGKKGRARAILVKIIRPFNRLILWILKGKFDAEVSINKLLDEMELVNKTIKNDSSKLVTSIGLALMTHLSRLGALYLVFLALGTKITFSPLLIGYIVGMVLVVVAPTPNGIGFVEGGMVLMYTSMGVPASVAGTAVIIYRGFQFWIPFLIGLFFVQGNQLKKLKADVEALNEEKNIGVKNE